MFFHFLYPLAGEHSLFNVFKYITVRSFLAFILSVIISIVWGKRFIAYMKLKQFGQIVRSDGPESHKKKSGTPTFGGVFILGSIFITAIFTGNFTSLPFLLVLGVALSYFCLGGLDDYLKVLKKNTDGVSARGKLVWQFATAGLVSFLMLYFNVIDGELYLPFIKGSVGNLGWGYAVFSSLVIVGSSNAVNLTDGLDGLAIGPIITSSATLGLLSYLCGHRELAQYLLIPHVPMTGELLVISAATIGAGIGFLWYNSYPAEIFMGDVGSLSLGGILGTTAVLTKNEFLFVIIGGIFVLEAISVILQVASYKTRKKRIFKMAPIHHHFELLGWPEPKVIVRFWIMGLVLSIIALASIKLR
jgi:phospho-N-acetylmuramoyl-pentapeptide-transferase